MSGRDSEPVKPRGSGAWVSESFGKEVFVPSLLVGPDSPDGPLPGAGMSGSKSTTAPEEPVMCAGIQELSDQREDDRD